MEQKKDYKFKENLEFVKCEKKSKQDKQKILQCLKNHFVFYNLCDEELDNVVEKMFTCQVSINKTIFQQGDPAECFFILKEGAMEVMVNQKAKRELKCMDGFGELALLYNANRSSTVKALENCKLWGIDRDSFRKAVDEMITKEYEENRKYMENIRFFQGLTNEQKDAISAVLIEQKFYKNQTIVNEGDPASSFYIIKEGTVTVSKGGQDYRKLGKNESFGEQALYYNTQRLMTVKAEDEVKCLTLGRDTLTKVLGDQVHSITFRNLQKWAFEKSVYLSKLTKNQIDKILDNMKISSYKHGEIIMKKGEVKTPKIIVVIEGSLKKSKSSQALVQKVMAWGEDFFLSKKKIKNIDDDIIMECDGVIAEIGGDQFLECIQMGKETKSLDKIIQEIEYNHAKKFQEADPEKRSKYKDFVLQNLIFIENIYENGQLGKIRLVKNTNDQSNKYYVLKCLNKHIINENELEKYIIQQRQVLEKVNHKFIVDYARSYKDKFDVYFLCQYIKGVSLFEVMKEIGLLSSYDAQFYSATMIIILEYLHFHNIIYRDMKPENLLVDHAGYLCLIDLSTAKILKGKHGMGNRAFTIIGTPHYMAPEVICGKGYNSFIDLWSVGICIYEMLCGGVPFGNDKNDPFEIYEAIIKNEYSYPEFFKDKKARKFIEQLLSRVPENRWQGSYESLKQNPWYENFDFEKLWEKDINQVPYVPSTDKYLSDNYIQQQALKKRDLIDVIQEDQKNRFQSNNSQNPQWDKDF